MWVILCADRCIGDGGTRAEPDVSEEPAPSTSQGVARRLDEFRRRHRWAGFPVAVIYKFVDDQGTYQAALLTYYGFVSLFPLLLLAVTVLGFVLSGDPAAQQAVLHSALRNVPVLGDQIGRQRGGGGDGSEEGLEFGGVEEKSGKVAGERGGGVGHGEGDGGVGEAAEASDLRRGGGGVGRGDGDAEGKEGEV